MTVIINGKEFPVEQEVADLLQMVSEERDDLEEELFLLKFEQMHGKTEYTQWWS